MNWQKKWIIFVSLCVISSPINLEAKVDLASMNLLENIETKSTENELVIKFRFKNRIKNFEQPIFFKKSIQVDFPITYSRPAKKFLTTGNDQISQIYVSQFNEKKMRVRFIFGKGVQGNYKSRFHLQKKDNLLIARVDLSEVDLLDRLLARATEKTKSNNNQPARQLNKKYKDHKTINKPVAVQAKQELVVESDTFKNNYPDKMKKASLTKNQQWKEDKKKLEKKSNSVAKASFGFLNSGDKKLIKPGSLVESGFKMVMTLSLVLGFIFLLFFGFKKYVLKNTVFGGGEKLIQVVSTNYLAPKKNISLVEVAGEILVLGISDQNISLLTTIREPERIEVIKNAKGNDNGGNVWGKGISDEVAGKVSLATSNTKNVFSKYLKEFSKSDSSSIPVSGKQASVAAVTEKIRRYTQKVRPA